jgi:hypothetical protein
MTFAILIGYAIGGSLGFAATRSERLARVWPRLVRAQILGASVVLATVAAWRLAGIDDVLWPLLMVAVYAVMLVVALLTTSGERRAGRATLRTWSAMSNTGFFVIPFAAAFGGPSAVLIAVLIDRFGAPLWAVYIHLLRRDAPRQQKAFTRWIDQAPLIALGVGLLLRAITPAPEWTAGLSLVAAPVMAATGAALFVGSVLHASQRISPRSGVRAWVSLTLLRIALFVPIYLLAPSPAVALVAVLAALSIPAFGPSQMSLVYGYAEPVVAASVRYGWFIGAAGLIAAYAVSRP